MIFCFDCQHYINNKTDPNYCLNCVKPITTMLDKPTLPTSIELQIKTMDFIFDTILNPKQTNKLIEE